MHTWATIKHFETLGGVRLMILQTSFMKHFPYNNNLMNITWYFVRRLQVHILMRCVCISIDFARCLTDSEVQVKMINSSSLISIIFFPTLSSSVWAHTCTRTHTNTRTLLLIDRLAHHSSVSAARDSGLYCLCWQKQFAKVGPGDRSDCSLKSGIQKRGSVLLPDQAWGDASSCYSRRLYLYFTRTGI